MPVLAPTLRVGEYMIKIFTFLFKDVRLAARLYFSLVFSVCLLWHLAFRFQFPQTKCCHVYEKKTMGRRLGQHRDGNSILKLNGLIQFKYIVTYFLLHLFPQNVAVLCPEK